MEEQTRRLYSEDIDSGRPTSASIFLGMLDSQVSARSPAYRKAKELRNYLREEDGVPVGEKLAYLGREKVEDYVINKLKDLGERALTGPTDFVFGKEWGKRVRGGFYNRTAETLVDMATREYLRGHSYVKLTPKRFGSKELTDKNGKKLLGKFKGRKAYIAEDIENALGEHYETVRQTAGMTKEQLNFAAQQYFGLHENNEYFVKKILKREMSEDEHAKFESDNMKSLFKYRRTMAGADEIYRVGMAINSLRTDEFGRGVQKYLRGDMLAAGLN